jgi:hypothetical protein
MNPRKPFQFKRRKGEDWIKKKRYQTEKTTKQTEAKENKKHQSQIKRWLARG